MYLRSVKYVVRYHSVGLLIVPLVNTVQEEVVIDLHVNVFHNQLDSSTALQPVPSYCFSQQYAAEKSNRTEHELIEDQPSRLYEIRRIEELTYDWTLQFAPFSSRNTAIATLLNSDAISKAVNPLEV